jgi:hypothetical protein
VGRSAEFDDHCTSHGASSEEASFETTGSLVTSCAGTDGVRIRWIKRPPGRDPVLGFGLAVRSSISAARSVFRFQPRGLFFEFSRAVCSWISASQSNLRFRSRGRAFAFRD